MIVRTGCTTARSRSMSATSTMTSWDRTRGGSGAMRGCSPPSSISTRQRRVGPQRQPEPEPLEPGLSGQRKTAGHCAAGLRPRALTRRRIRSPTAGARARVARMGWGARSWTCCPPAARCATCSRLAPAALARSDSSALCRRCCSTLGGKAPPPPLLAPFRPLCERPTVCRACTGWCMLSAPRTGGALR